MLRHRVYKKLRTAETPDQTRDAGLDMSSCQGNQLTISSQETERSRFPGLSIWLRSGQKMEVKVPVGCLLIQTGKQLEWLTGGECLAGMHEVVVTKRTLQAVALARQQTRSLWRVSSTLFAHIASDAMLKPLGHFAETSNTTNYPPICAGDYVEKELSVINLKGSNSCS
ncbi:uncharacterized protein [Typha latifolia]|uniref:uncharacterized protein n=1 Tax=Typha latifolia TaxID=4733 RepID=UPI003C2DD874